MRALTRGLLVRGSSEAWMRGAQVLVTLVAARWLGPEVYGRYAHACAILVPLAQLTSFGLPVLVCREVAANAGRVGSWVRTALHLKVSLALVVAALGALVFVASDLATPPGWWLVLGAGLLLLSTGEILGHALRGLRSLGREGVAVAAGGTAFAATALLLLSGGWGPEGLAWAMVAGGATSVVLGARGLVRRAGWDALARARARPLVASLGLLVPFAALAALETTYPQVDLLLLGWLAGPRAAGYLASASRVPIALMLGVQVGLGAIFPTYVAADPALRRRWGPRLVMALGALGLVLGLLVGAPRVTWILLLFGPSYGPAAPYLGALAVALPAWCIGAGLQTLIVAEGGQRPLALWSASMLVLSAGVGVWLVLRWGPVALLWARAIESWITSLFRLGLWWSLRPQGTAQAAEARP